MITQGGAALLVVDMLNDFCADGGVMTVPGSGELYGPINELAAAARTAGAPVIWICDRHGPGDREFDIRPPHCLGGSWGAAIVPELRQEPGDLYVPKRRYSAFFGTDLDLLLREQDVRTVVVVGVMTNICVRATVHDAFFHGYQVVVPSDGVASISERDQESTLDDIRSCFGTVTTAKHIVPEPAG